MSRGSSGRRRSSSSSPSSTSRRTWTCRAGPWQRCTCTDRSAGSRLRPSGRGASARRSAWSQPSSVSGSSVTEATSWSPDGGPEAALQLALVAAQRGEQRVADPAVADVVAAGHGTGRSASRCHRSSLGCGSHRCRSWWVASARSSSISVAGIRVWPNSEIRGGRSLGAGRAAGSSVAACRWCGWRRADRRGEGAPQRRLPGQVAVERVAEPVGGLGRRTSRRAAAAAGRRTTRTARPGAAPRRSGGRGGTRPRRRCRGGPGGARGSPPRARPSRRRAPTAAARPGRRAPTGRRRGCR